jgi:hypothetical protein
LLFCLIILWRGQTRRWIKQWEKSNSKKIDEDADWQNSGYICPYCAEKVLESYVPPILVISQHVALLATILYMGSLKSCSSDFTKATLTKTDSKDWSKNIKTL